jgi:1,4-alpha-glucan branching enzyme
MKKILFTTAMLFIVGLMWSQVNVTFRVDMNGVTGYTTPEVNGTFNGWCGATCNPMTDANSDGVWETTLALNAGSYEFKYAYDNWNGGGESLTAGTPCTITSFGNTNRTLTVESTDIVMPIVCYGSCSACGASTVRAVTFQVDLSNINGFTTPTVNGTFNGFSGTANPLSDPESDGIWSTTINLPDGIYEYKFAYDNWAGQETLIPGSSCTVTSSGYTNRRVVVSADATLPVACWGSCSNCAAALLPKNVTFRVDMQNVTGFTTPEVNGSFNGFCGNCNPLTDANSDGIWETTIQLNQDTFEYKFSYDGWAGQENLTPGSSCTSTIGGYTNRSIIVGNADQVLPIVCWDLCTNCAPPTRNVTFKVDMSQVAGFNAATDVPCVNGTFENWAGGTYPMTDANNDGVWERTIALADGSYEYKFAYNGWAASEQLTAGSSCTVTSGVYTNRSLTVNGSNLTLSNVCWASCNSCAAPTYDITFQINMENESGFGTPYLSGTFNGWCGNCNPLTDSNNDGVYTATIPLQTGVYEYKVSRDNWAGSEQLASGSSCTVTNGSNTNRSLTVGTTAQTLPVVCYGTCSDCVTPIAVTFQVNMNQVSGYGVPEVNGSFNSWCGGCFQLTDFDNDNVYTGTAYIAPGTYEYKFAYDSWAGQENLVPGSSCTITDFGYTNRRLVVTGDTILPIDCWASCGACVEYYDVTFQVDMSQVTGFNIPEVNGDFNAWCGGCFQLTDPDGNGIYSGTATIQSGPHEFKFAHDAWSGQESLTQGSPCTITPFGYTNRFINVQSDMVLPVACWGQCGNCGYAVNNDSPYSAVNVQYSINSAFPNCYSINGTTANATNSPQSSGFSGKDTWYKFTAQSTGVSITLTGSGQDDAIALYSKSGSSFNLMSGAVENASSGAGDFERLNYTGLTPGTVYYVSVGAADATTSGAFALCIQHLLATSCATAIPAAGLSLCDSYKAIYRGAPSQGVTYTFNFNGVGGGATGTTTLSGTNGLTTLSHPTYALRYGGVYNASIDVRYNLLNSASTPEPIDVIGASAGNCSAVSIRTQPNLEVKFSQRCPSALLRSNFLTGTPVSGDPRACSAVNYTYEFTQVASCAVGTNISVVPATYTTATASPYLGLGVLGSLPNAGAWNVRIRPNFTYGPGSFGPMQRILVNSTSAGAMLNEDEAEVDFRMLEEGQNWVVYPNPSNGNAINVQAFDVQSEQVSVRVIDAMGRVVYNRSFSVNGALNTSVVFDQALSAGIYTVEFTDNDIVKSERLMIQK